jgi:hypothetical protein
MFIVIAFNSNVKVLLFGSLDFIFVSKHENTTVISRLILN